MVEQAAAAADGTSSTDVTEPPDADGPIFAETDPSGRYGRFDQVLGRGAFKTVYKAFDTQEGTEVAWNQVRVSELVNCRDLKEERDRLFAEIRVLKQLKHKNIMTFFDYWLDPKTMNINFITELFTSGTLRQYRKRHKHIDEEVLKRWAWQILCGLVYLHGHTPPIIHRDLKCDNIFINGSDGTVKIGDLGLATMLRSRTAPQSVLGTPEFMAPELYEEEYDDRVDVYSFGMCMLELATMEYPYSECKNAAQIYRKVSLGVRPAGLQKVTNQELADFINLCISPRDQRPRSRMLLKHPYFDSIRPCGQLSSKSQGALSAMVSQPDSLSDYGGSGTSGLSRSSSTTVETAMALGSVGLATGTAAPASAGSPLPTGPSSAGSAAGISRTTSAITDAAHSDAASLKSHRSNVSDLTSVLTDITEEGETADNGEDAVAMQRWEEPIPSAPPTAATPGFAPAAPASLPSRPGSATFNSPVVPSSPLHSPVVTSPPSSRAPSPVSAFKPGRPSIEDELIMEMEAENSRGEYTCCNGDTSKRRFMVVGKYQEDNDTFNLRLRICEPGGQVRTVEFEFDISSDTAISVASEMVEDLQLSQEDAAAIAAAIRDEIANLTTNLEEQLSLSLEQASAALQEGLYQSAALANSSPRPSYMDHAAKLALERAPSAEAQAAAPTPAVAPAIATTSSGVGEAGAGSEEAVPKAPTLLTSVSGPFVQDTSPALPAHSVHFWPGVASSMGGSATPTASLATAKSLGSASSLHSIASSHNSGETAASAVTAASHLSGYAGEDGCSLAFAQRPMSPPARITSPPIPSRLPPGPPVLAPSPSPCASHPAISRLLRSNSGIGPTFGRSATMPMREKDLAVVASPKDAHSLPASGALSPSSGILSPATAHDRRIPLNKLFENLQDLAALRADPVAAAAAAAAEKPVVNPGAGLFPSGGSIGSSSSAGVSPRQLAAAGQDRLPPLPQQTRSVVGSLSRGSSVEALPAMVAGDATLVRPASEACLSGLLEQFDPFNLTSGSASDPTQEHVVAVLPSNVQSGRSAPAAAQVDSPPELTTCRGAAVAMLASDTVARLVEANVLREQLGTEQQVSAPGSKTSSRDVSPSRVAALSPTRSPTRSQQQQTTAAFACDAAAALFVNAAKKGKTDADKEALRKQAADAMKAVELRSLNLLEGGLLAGKTVRGTPMAATRLTGLAPGCLGGNAQGAMINAVAAPAACSMAMYGPSPGGVPPASVTSSTSPRKPGT